MQEVPIGKPGRGDRLGGVVEQIHILDTRRPRTHSFRVTRR